MPDAPPTWRLLLLAALRDVLQLAKWFLVVWIVVKVVVFVLLLMDVL